MSDSKKIEATDASKARKFFVENYKKMKKNYLSTLVNRTHYSGLSIELKLTFITRMIMEIDFPAEMWDNSSNDEIKILWLSMKDLMYSESDELREAADEINIIVKELELIDLNNYILPIVNDNNGTTKVPNCLYHASLTMNANSIMDKGIIPMGNRNNVFLYEDPFWAEDVGFRHGSDVVLFQIDTEGLRNIYGKDCLEMKDFGRGPVWITKEVCPSVITIYDDGCDDEDDDYN
jgi:hypothetical protein